tara:strand:- start:146 stop:370 length:225 start_codon:yes stop_codon:yes gene_type:complete
MGDLVGIDGGKAKAVTIELEVIECGVCESAIFAWKVDVKNPKHHIISCCVCGYLYPLLEAEQSNVLAEFDEEGE